MLDILIEVKKYCTSYMFCVHAMIVLPDSAAGYCVDAVSNCFVYNDVCAIIRDSKRLKTIKWTKANLFDPHESQCILGVNG
jgi:hypothetical protein